MVLRRISKQPRSPGDHNDDVEQSACTSWVVGKYQDEYWATDWKECLPGRIARRAGAAVTRAVLGIDKRFADERMLCCSMARARQAARCRRRVPRGRSQPQGRGHAPTAPRAPTRARAARRRALRAWRARSARRARRRCRAIGLVLERHRPVRRQLHGVLGGPLVPTGARCRRRVLQVPTTARKAGRSVIYALQAATRMAPALSSAKIALMAITARWGRWRHCRARVARPSDWVR